MWRNSTKTFFDSNKIWQNSLLQIFLRPFKVSPHSSLFPRRRLITLYKHVSLTRHEKNIWVVHINPRILFVVSACWSFFRKLFAAYAASLRLAGGGWKRCLCNYILCRLMIAPSFGHEWRRVCFYLLCCSWRRLGSFLWPRHSEMGKFCVSKKKRKENISEVQWSVNWWKLTLLRR